MKQIKINLDLTVQESNYTTETGEQVQLLDLLHYELTSDDQVVVENHQLISANIFSIIQRKLANEDFNINQAVN